MIISRRGLGLGLLSCGFAAALTGGAHAQDDDYDGPPNLFISPCGQPFRAKIGQPYPVAAWFKQTDKNADGQIDHAEFLADAEAFFKQLDLDHDGVLSPVEVAIYEHNIVPEILGFPYQVSEAPARLWLAQMGGGGGMGGGGMGGGGGGMGGRGGGRQSEPSQSDSNDSLAPKRPLDESAQGASPYSFFDEPEPVTAADLQFDNMIKLPNFLKLADDHFQTLDSGGRGYLTLDKLPRTAAQQKIEKWARRRHRRS